MTPEEINRLKGWDGMLLIIYIVLFITALILVIIYITNHPLEEKFFEQNIVIPKQYSGFYYSLEDPIGIAVFDLNDDEQVLVAQQVSSFFRNYNIQLNTGG